jgi:hypothetical protein
MEQTYFSGSSHNMVIVLKGPSSLLESLKGNIISCVKEMWTGTASSFDTVYWLNEVRS